MDVSDLKIAGDVNGVEWSLPVLSFKGSNPAAPSIYLQAALHADELPGTAVLHFVCDFLREYEAKGLIAGDITIGPSANPIGANQKVLSLNLGRFEIGGRDNFNRSFPLISYDDRGGLIENAKGSKAVDTLKAHLLSMALNADIVLDLHCDSEALLYAYICEEFWPRSQDLASALDLDVVFLSDGQSSAFEEAVAYAWRQGSDAKNRERLVSTLEYRGERDVDKDVAVDDAKKLIEFFKGRGIVKSDHAGDVPWSGLSAPLDDIEVIRADVSGAILFHVNCGDEVKDGDGLVSVIRAPGREAGVKTYYAPQAGLVVSRCAQRFVHVQDQLLKVAGYEPSKTKRKPGTLEQ